jgi:septal ring factor EnvC (AmiA/AmiB activator)
MRLNSLQAAIKSQAAQIKLTAQNLETEQAHMQKLFSQKSILQAHFESESLIAKQNAEELGKRAKNLEDLLKKLEKERQAQMRKMADAAYKQKPVLSVSQPAAVAGAFAKSKGSLPLPARGHVIQRYGDTTIGGGSAKGITMETRKSAQVVAPFDGNVLFAGYFKDYGNLIILEHGEGYYTLLAGLTRIDCSVGQSVLTGEPVGVMSSQKTEKLYIEFRQNGQAINPSGWFASKV